MNYDRQWKIPRLKEPVKLRRPVVVTLRLSRLSEFSRIIVYLNNTFAITMKYSVLKSEHALRTSSEECI